MKIHPLGERILVKRVEAETKKGGIIIPDSAKEKPQEAKVVALGSGKLLKSGKRQPFEVKVGDRVILESWGGSEVSIGEEKYLLVKESDILAKVK